MKQGISLQGFVPVRNEPSHTAEMGSQVLFGETFQVLETSGSWIRISIDFDETVLWPVLLERILLTMIERNIALEVNTAGLRRPESVTYPNSAVLRLYRTLGGELVTTGSDTHRDPWVFHALHRATELLRETGFTHTVRFADRERIACPLRSCPPGRTAG